jgi:thermolabile hemolysin
MSSVRLGVVPGLLALSLIAMWTTPIAAGPYSQIVAFGDSLSDTGNDFIAFGSPQPPYYMGRFSNGPIWLDYLATKLGVPDPGPSLGGGTNYAYGGATAGSLNQSVPDLGQQVQMYLQKSPKADPNAVYTVLAGANDFFGGQTDPSVPANAVNAALTSLIGAGAKTILVSNLPPQGITPLIRSEGSAAVAAINALDVAFNADLAADVTSLRAANSGVKIDVLDLYSLSNAVIQDPAAYGFTDVTDEGINAGPNANLNQYLFWDDVHPTTAGHGYIADAAFSALVPEPGGLTLASVSGIGLALRFWRRKRPTKGSSV